MCTLAWGKDHAGFWVCFNRDERRARPPAEPPSVHPVNNGRLIYATDPLGGGTWFAASTNGFVVALLNHYPAQAVASGENHLSRGQLVLKVAASPSVEGGLERLLSENLENYAPFHLFLLSRGIQEGKTWDQRCLESLQPAGQFWTTSSYRPGEVVQWRNRAWKAAAGGEYPNAQRAGEIFRQAHPDDPAYGLTMDRDDARTVSQIELEMSPRELKFAYRARDPGGTGYLDARMITISPLSEDA